MDAPQDDELSSLGKARERLYTPNEPIPTPEPALPPGLESVAPRTWRSAIPQIPMQNIGNKQHVHYAARFFLIALSFFVVAVAVAAVLFFTGTNSVSVDNVALLVQGPTTIAGGDTVPLSISVTNKNPIAIHHATLEIDFPEGTRNANDITKDNPRYSEDLGTLSPGQTVERSVKAVLFGNEGAQINIPVSVSYGTDNSNAVFVKRTPYPLAVSTAPLSVSIDAISETVSGKSFTIRATVRSNATAPLDGVVLAAQYPAGYTLVSSSITPVGNNFPIGKLNPGASKLVTLTGTLTGQNTEERVFHFSVGTARSANDPALSVSYMSQDAHVLIAAPFLATSISVNGSNAATPVVSPGDTVSVTINWSNTLTVPVQNADIEVTLSGAGLDYSSIQSQNGFYRSSDHTVIFSRDTDASLASLSPNASGLGSLTFHVLPTAARNSTLSLSVSIAGNRVGQDNVPVEVSSSIAKNIKVASSVAFTTSTFHTSGPLPNSGPVPPVANQATTYTVVWKVVNTGNDLADGTISATLPIYVTYTGQSSPANGLTYSQTDRTVRWNVGDIHAGTTVQMAFQVSLTPSTSQHGLAPALTSAPQLSGFDRFAQIPVSATAAAPTTLTADPGSSPTQGYVQ